MPIQRWAFIKVEHIIYICAHLLLVLLHNIFRTSFALDSIFIVVLSLARTFIISLFFEHVQAQALGKRAYPLIFGTLWVLLFGALVIALFVAVQNKIDSFVWLGIAAILAPLLTICFAGVRIYRNK